MVSELSGDIITERAWYFIRGVKAPLLKFIIALCMRYPKPTKENTSYHNTHVLMDIWEEFFEYEGNPGREPLFRALERISICEYEHDPYYRHRIEWFAEKLFEKYLSGEWEPRIQTRPSRNKFWREPLDVKTC